MNKILKIAAAIALFVVLVFCFYMFLGKTKTETPRKLGFKETIESADRVNVVAVGLGKQERHRFISGRLYQNFVQLLKTNGRLNDKEIFTDDCKVGVELEFYRDTVLLGNFRMTNRIGRDSVAGVWETRHMAKVNKFLKDQSVQFVACKTATPVEGFVDDSLLVGRELERVILSMPKFGATRSSKKNEERNASLDSVNKMASESAALSESLAGESQNALKVLDEMLMPADTAIGEPLGDRFARWNRVEVVFFDSSMAAQAEKTYSLDEKQIQTLADLFKNSVMETFSMSDRPPAKNDVVICLYKDSVPEMELWEMNGQKYNVLLKRAIQPSGFTENEGFLVPQNSEALKAFFDSIK